MLLQRTVVVSIVVACRSPFFFATPFSHKRANSLDIGIAECVGQHQFYPHEQVAALRGTFERGIPFPRRRNT
jgi:hypothetical protein